MKFETGMLVVSKAGHDRGKVYVITDVNENEVYVADGKNKTVCRAKKKEQETSSAGAEDTDGRQA